MFKKTGRGVSQLASVFFTGKRCIILKFQHVKSHFFPMPRRFFVFLRHIVFIISPPSLPSHNFTSSLFSSLLFSPLLSSSLLSLPSPLRCLCCVSVLCCCRLASLCCVAALLSLFLPSVLVLLLLFLLLSLLVLLLLLLVGFARS